ncbi:MAG: ABC transporter ATP-binding protein/permease [Alphaproteobacteria bacterium]|nr:ABC transporter ATP-binding protein/permease [Alphaproteobacteria bacterium]
MTVAASERAAPAAPANPAAQRRRADWDTVRTLLPYLWPADRPELKRRVLLAFACLIAAKLATVSVPFLFKGAVDAMNAPGLMVQLPLGLILAYGLARVLGQGFGELRDAVFSKVVQNAKRRVALGTFRHLHGLALRFHLERQTGGISRAIERGTAGIQFMVQFTVLNIIPTLFEVALVCALLMIVYDVGFALATLLTIGGYIVYTLTVTEWRTKFRRAMNETDSEANTKAIDSLLNYETVKYFGNEGHEARRYDESLARYETAAVRSQVSLSMLNIGQGFIIACGLSAVMLMAALRIVEGSMTLGDFVAVNTFMIQLYLPLNFLGFVYREIKQALVDIEKLFGLLREQAEIRDAPDAKPLAVTGGGVEFDRVGFAYDPRRPILEAIDFRIPAGHTLAIVGPSGAGKSTVSRLLFRFYDATQGAIRIDGQDIRAVTQASLRAAIGIVPQDTVLFNDTLRYNIRYGRPDATDAEVERAAELAQLGHLIKRLPDGWKAMVGERGLKLSGGEKQRVAIARTILKNPPILVLDEATSALDTATEKEIQASLKEISANRTTLIIAHRLSTVVHADEILVLDDGRVVERGCHEDLLAREGVYAGMWRRQQETGEATVNGAANGAKIGA